MTRHELDAEVAPRARASASTPPRSAPGASGLAAAVLKLQRTAGNAAVVSTLGRSRLLQRREPPADRKHADYDPLRARARAALAKGGDDWKVAAVEIAQRILADRFPDMRDRVEKVEWNPDKADHKPTDASVRAVLAEGTTLFVGDIFVRWTANDFLEDAVADIETQLIKIGGGRGDAAAGTRAAGAAPFRVILVDFNGNLGTTMRASMRAGVEHELDRVAATSRVANVQRGFDVVFGSAPAQGEIAGFDRRDFVVYVFDRPPRESRAKTILLRHLDLTDDEADVRATAVVAQLAAEGGINVPDGRNRSVSFVNVAHAAGTLGQLKWDKLTEGRSQVGQQVAELILHEVGHALGADHVATGLMHSPVDVSINPAQRPADEHFSAASDTTVRRGMEALRP